MQYHRHSLQYCICLSVPFCYNSGIGIKVLHIIHQIFFDMDCKVGCICIIVAIGLLEHIRRHVLEIKGKPYVF